MKYKIESEKTTQTHVYILYISIDKLNYQWEHKKWKVFSLTIHHLSPKKNIHYLYGQKQKQQKMLNIH